MKSSCGGDPLKADVNHHGRYYGLEWPIKPIFSPEKPSVYIYLITNFFWPILSTFRLQKRPFLRFFFLQMFILGSTVHFGEHCSYWGANGIVKRLLFMNSAPQNEQRSPKWTVLPKMNRSLYTIPLAPQNKQCSSKRTVLPNMNIWRKKLKKMANGQLTIPTSPCPHHSTALWWMISTSLLSSLVAILTLSTLCCCVVGCSAPEHLNICNVKPAQGRSSKLGLHACMQ